MNREQELELYAPYIPWREPIRVTRTDGVSGIACRFCITINGLHASDIEDLFQDEDEWRKHMGQVHGREVGGEHDQARGAQRQDGDH